MKKIKRVFKYGTGDVVPEGAIYLSTQIEKKIESAGGGVTYQTVSFETNRLVWHYFLVEVEE